MTQNKSEYLIIDGYNVIEAAPELFKKMPALENRRDHLLRMIRSTPYLRNKKIIVVFDGSSPQGTPKKYRHHNIQVIFSGAQQEADQVIQDMIREESPRKSLLIISSDHEIQNTARDHNTQTSSSQAFWQQSRPRRSNQNKSHNTDYSKEKDLSQREVQEWLQIFKEGQQGNDEN
jgi:predicted RNA-binding protein with PIN domain